MKHFYPLLGNILSNFDDYNEIYIQDKDTEEIVCHGSNKDIVNFLTINKQPWYYIENESKIGTDGKFHLYLIVKNLNNLFKMLEVKKI